MYTKKILSAVTAMAITSTGAMAFEAMVTDLNGSTPLTEHVTPTPGSIEGNGTIMTVIPDTTGGTRFIRSNYINSGTVPSVLAQSPSFKGDALLYPAFNQKEGWGTEIVVRNTTNQAIVAKAVVYGGEDSHEVKDFNIYLSAKDVCRFTIENGKITSTDGSIRTFGIYPHQVSVANSGTSTTTQDLTDYRDIAFADTKPLDEELTEEYGYVAIFGMEQSAGVTSISKPRGSAATLTTPQGFDHAHDALYAAYAATLDNARNGWRAVVDPTKGAIKNGLFIKGAQGPTAAPNVDGNITVSWEKFYVDALGQNQIMDYSATFTDVASNALTGQVRIYNAAEGRDMLLNATAITNFTDDVKNTRMLWTEGEYASIADRCIVIEGNVTSGQEAVYDLGCIKADAAQFMINSAVYTYANAAGTIENKLLFTQPYKRVLAQLNNATVNRTKYAGLANGQYIYDPTNVAGAKYQTLETGTGYNFAMSLKVYDEDENTPVASIGGTIITSPQTTGATAVTFNKELQEVNADQLEKGLALDGEFDSKNGFVDITNIPMPAIVTQMVGSTAGSTAEMNWVYSDKN